MTKGEIIEWIDFLEAELKRDKITPQERKKSEEKLAQLKEELKEKEKEEKESGK